MQTIIRPPPGYVPGSGIVRPVASYASFPTYAAPAAPAPVYDSPQVPVSAFTTAHLPAMKYQYTNRPPGYTGPLPPKKARKPRVKAAPKPRKARAKKAPPAAKAPRARKTKAPSEASKAKNLATTQDRLRRYHQAALDRHAQDGSGFTASGHIAVGKSGGVLRITRAGTKYYVGYPRR